MLHSSPCNQYKTELLAKRSPTAVKRAPRRPRRAARASRVSPACVQPSRPSGANNGGRFILTAAPFFPTFNSLSCMNQQQATVCADLQ